MGLHQTWSNQWPYPIDARFVVVQICGGGYSALLWARGYHSPAMSDQVHKPALTKGRFVLCGSLSMLAHLQ